MPRKSIITLPLGDQETISVFACNVRQVCPAELRAVRQAEKRLQQARRDKDSVEIALANQELECSLAVLLQALLKAKIALLQKSTRLH